MVSLWMDEGGRLWPFDWRERWISRKDDCARIYRGFFKERLNPIQTDSCSERKGVGFLDTFKFLPVHINFEDILEP